MKEIIEFLSQSPAFHIATADENGKPRVRPFSFVMEWNGKLAFTTNVTKEVYKQLTANPNIEISSFNATSGEWMRIRGAVKFTTDINAKRKVFEVMPALGNIYTQKENDPSLTCFYIESGVAETFSFTAASNPIKSVNI